MSGMLDWISYDWARALHIIFMVAWMAAMLMGPRLLIYQRHSQPGEALFEEMVLAFRRLRMIILNPGIVLTWVFGLIMLAKNWDFLISQPWMHVKLSVVTILSAMHGWLVGLGRKMARGERPVGEKTLRMLNEVPFIIAIIAIIMVVVQPFAR